MPWENKYPTISMEVEGATLRVLSLGAGVQSTTLAIAVANGEIGPMPDYAIFSDTDFEPQEVYDHLDRLEKMLPFPVLRVNAGSLRHSIMNGRENRSGRFASVPFFIKDTAGKIGMGKRQCTTHYKLEPIVRELRRLLGVEPRKRILRGTVEQWIGISTDEVTRMRPARQQWIVNRWPLIEAGMNRNDCLRYLARFGIKPPKSACIICPFHTNQMWRRLRDNPVEWAQIIEADKAIRNGGSGKELRGEQFLHRSCLPIDQAPIDAPDANALGFDQECEGMCGT